jgi:hypothetical protein
MGIFCCKLQVEFMIFLRYRKERLKEIHRNLAVQSIKNCWKRQKLSIKIMRNRIARAKRIKVAKQNKEAFEKYLASLGGGMISPKMEPEKQNVEEKSKKEKNSGENAEAGSEKSGSAEGKQQEEEERLYKESERIKSMIQRRIKYLVEKGKVAYGIKPKTARVVIPVINEKAINNYNLGYLEDDSKFKFYESTCSIIAKSRPASREHNKRSRIIMLNSPQNNKSTYWPTKDDQSSQLSFMLPVEFDGSKVKSVESENFLAFTSSFINKVEDIPSVKSKIHALRNQSKPTKKHVNLNFPINFRLNANKPEKKQPKRWIPIARNLSTYVPGLDNSSYVPEKWTPKKYSRNAFTTIPGPRLSTSVDKRELSVVSRSTGLGFDGFPGKAGHSSFGEAGSVSTMLVNSITS